MEICNYDDILEAVYGTAYIYVYVIYSRVNGSSTGFPNNIKREENKGRVNDSGYE